MVSHVARERRDDRTADHTVVDEERERQNRPGANLSVNDLWALPTCGASCPAICGYVSIRPCRWRFHRGGVEMSGEVEVEVDSDESLVAEVWRVADDRAVLVEYPDEVAVVVSQTHGQHLLLIPGRLRRVRLRGSPAVAGPHASNPSLPRGSRRYYSWPRDSATRAPRRPQPLGARLPATL